MLWQTPLETESNRCSPCGVGTTHRHAYTRSLAPTAHYTAEMRRADNAGTKAPGAHDTLGIISVARTGLVAGCRHGAESRGVRPYHPRTESHAVKRRSGVLYAKYAAGPFLGR